LLSAVIEGVQLWRDPLAADIAATRLSDPVQGHLEAAAAAATAAVTAAIEPG